MTHIAKKYDFSRSMYIEDKEIHCFYFFKEGKVIASVRWFDFDSIDFPFEIKKIKTKVKFDLMKERAFYVRNVADKFDKCYNVYIHADLVDLRFVTNKLVAGTWYNTITQDVYSIELTGERFVRSSPNNATGTSYATYRIEFGTNYKATETNEWDRCEKIAKEMTEVMCSHIDPYNVHLLLEKYTIRKKREKK